MTIVLIILTLLYLISWAVNIVLIVMTGTSRNGAVKYINQYHKDTRCVSKYYGGIVDSVSSAELMNKKIDVILNFGSLKSCKEYLTLYLDVDACLELNDEKCSRLINDAIRYHSAFTRSWIMGVLFLLILAVIFMTF